VWIVWTKWMAKIFDFDRATVSRLGENKLLTQSACDIDNHCNEVIPNKDMIKLLAYYRHGLSRTWDVVSSVMGGSVHRGKFRQMGDFLRYDGRRLTRQNFKDWFYPPIKILKKLLSISAHKKWGVEIGSAADVAAAELAGETVYRISADMFTANGTPKKSTEKNQSVKVVDAAHTALDDTDAIISFAEGLLKSVTKSKKDRSVAKKGMVTINYLLLDANSSRKLLADELKNPNVDQPRLNTLTLSSLRAARALYSQVSDVAALPAK